MPFGKRSDDVTKVHAKLTKDNIAVLRWNKAKIKRYHMAVYFSKTLEFEIDVRDLHHYEYQCQQVGSYEFRVQVVGSTQEAKSSKTLITYPVRVTGLVARETHRGLLVEWDDLGAPTYLVNVFRPKKIGWRFITRYKVRDATECLISRACFCGEKTRVKLEVQAVNENGKVSAASTYKTKYTGSEPIAVQYVLFMKDMKLTAIFAVDSVSQREIDSDSHFVGSGCHELHLTKNYTSVVTIPGQPNLTQGLLVKDLVQSDTSQRHVFDLATCDVHPDDNVMYALHSEGKPIKQPHEISIRRESSDHDDES